MTPDFFPVKENPWSHWSVETLLAELLDLRKSGWNGVGYMMAGKNQTERLFLVAGADAFAQLPLIRAALEGYREEGRMPFFRYYLTHEPSAPTVKQELCRVSSRGSTVVAELVVSLDVPGFFEQVMAGEHGEYLRHRARLGCMQVLGKVSDPPDAEDHGAAGETSGLHGIFGQGGIN